MSLQEVYQLCTELKREVSELKSVIEEHSRPASETILDDVDLQRTMNVSKRTVSTWREKKLIKHTWIGGKVYYIYSDLLDTIERNSIPATKKPSSKIRIKI